MYVYSVIYSIFQWIFSFAVLAFRIIPAVVLTPDKPASSDVTLQMIFETAFWIAVSLFLLIPHSTFDMENPPDSGAYRPGNTENSKKLWIPAVPATLCFLYLSNLLCSTLFPVPTETATVFSFSKDTKSFIYLAEAAFLEEFLYRGFLPRVIGWFFPKHSSDGIPLSGVILSVAIFALSHRYLGWGAVCNATLGGMLFFLLAAVSSQPGKNPVRPLLITGFVHFIYNLILCLSM